MYKLEYLKSVQEGLETLKDRVLNNGLISNGMGICGNLAVIIRDDSTCYDLIQKEMGVWENQEVVESLRGSYSRTRSNGTMWKGVYLTQRLELIDYLIKKVGERIDAIS